ncbi:MAG: quinone-dependent dihydroorotate dehydrogenase [Bacteroidetes bacterium]|nr:quinone-dependent dihydroorotate dehydrogenase [Bacteroidota bacterium]
MYRILRFFLFFLSAEKAHYVAMDLLAVALKIPGFAFILKRSFKAENPHSVQFLGIKFPNRIGLAAGFDKNAKWLHLLKTLGFGHVEVGTVTPLPQDGNPKPRLFRLKKDKALINRMGFNNEGLDAMVKRLRHRPDGLIVGGNIGKNKITPNEHALEDYVKCYLAIVPHVDYIAVNVSSPNTPGLRDLQEKEFLTELFVSLHTLRENSKYKKPILLKIAPDLSVEALDEIIETIKKVEIDGVIATNTTISRENLKTDKAILNTIGNGGLSGKPLLEKSNEILEYLRHNLGKNYPIIGVGGVMDTRDMYTKINKGANLVQVYTGFIYSGPWMAKRWAAV